MLKDFAFPFLLAFISLLPAWFALNAEGNAKRLWFSVWLALIFIAVLSYIWGDPVRGPFARMIHPHAEDTFAIHAGGVTVLPIKMLSRGIDFSSAIKMKPQPIQLFVKRTWWGGWSCDLTILFNATRVTVMKHNEVSDQMPLQWDVNFDDHAIEVVDNDGRPMIQVIQDGDYDIYVNAVLNVNPNGVMIIKGNSLRTKALSKLTENDFPKPIFKHPAYANRGARL
jgi:hypothetical protein